MTGWGLLLAPGAGAGRDQSTLVALDGAATALGGDVRRLDFPYRLAGRRAPDKPDVLMAAVRREAEALCAEHGLEPSLVFMGGRSMGGRICSMAVAAGLPAAGLVLVSYPLHPPGHPEKPRTAHLGDIDVPCLFVSGTRDQFGSPAELEEAARLVPGPVTIRWLEGGDHSLRNRDAAVVAAASEWLATCVASARG